MRTLIIVLAILGVLFIALLTFAGNRAGPQDASGFQMGGIGRFIAGLPLPKRPQIRIAYKPFAVTMISGAKRFHIGGSDLATRVVTLALTGGSAARASYNCDAGASCSSSFCLVRSGAAVPGGCRSDTSDTGSLIVDKSGGDILVEALDTQGAIIESR
jgi:hypothetical protein